MAIEGHRDYSLGSHWWLRMSWEANQNRAGNYSDVTLQLHIHAANGYYTTGVWGSRSVRLTIDGNTSTYSRGDSYFTVSSGRKLIASRTRRINHNSDGTKSITMSVNTEVMLQLGGSWYGTASWSISATLDKIDVAPNIRVRANARWNQAEAVWVRDNGRWNRVYNAWVRDNGRWNKLN